MTDSSDADAGKGPEPEILKPDAEARQHNEKPRKGPRTLEGTAEEVGDETAAGGETRTDDARPKSAAGASPGAGVAVAASAGLGGAVVALAAAWFLGFGGPATGPVPDSRLDDIEARLAAVEPESGNDVRSIAARVQALGARLDAVEKGVATVEAAAPDAQMARLADEQQLLKQALDDTRRQVEAAQERIDMLAADLPPAGMADRVGGLDVLVKALDARLAALGPQIETMEARVVLLEEKKEDPDAAARAALGLALANLARTAETAAPFAAELDAVASFLPGEAGIASLSEIAARGVATRAALKARFPSVVEGIFDAERRAGAEGLWLRLVANAKSLVTIRRTGEISGATTEAIVARMEERLRTDDLAGAVAEGHMLQGPAGEAAAAWLDDAKARLEIDILLRDLSARVATQLSQGRE